MYVCTLQHIKDIKCTTIHSIAALLFSLIHVVVVGGCSIFPIFVSSETERERETPPVEAIAIADAATAYYLIKGIVVDDKRRSILCSFIALSRRSPLQHQCIFSL